MTTLTQTANHRKPVIPAPSRTSADPMDVARSLTLPRSSSLLTRVELVRDHFLAATGEEMSWPVAISVLDQLQGERGLSGKPTPIPVDLTPIACWLKEQRYDKDAILFVVRHIKATGSARLCPYLLGEDVSYVEDILGGIVGFDSRA